MIVEKINDIESLEHLCNSSNFFRNVMKCNRVEFLAPKVMELLNSTNYLNICNNRFKNSCSSILRLVCKSWCLSVENLWEQRNHFRIGITSKKTRSEDDSFKICAINSYEFGDAEQDGNSLGFIQHFETTHSFESQNPFLGKAVQICVSHSIPPSLNLLSKYGEHVRYAAFYLDYNRQTEMEENLRQLLHTMPNLNQVEINVNVGRVSYDVKCKKRCMPHLQNLYAVKAERACPIVSQILQANPSVLYLEISREEQVAVIETLSSHLQNLKHLKLDLAKANLLVPTHLNLKTPLLTALTVHWSNLCDYVNIFIWENFFHFINVTWGQNEYLTQVYLEIPRSAFPYSQEKLLSDGSRFRLKLEHVEKLVLLMGNSLSLDFLLPMKKTLQHLRVKRTCDLQCYNLKSSELYENSFQLGVKRQYIQFLGWENRLLESNIWSEFPNLKGVVLEGHTGHMSSKNRHCIQRMHERECKRYTRNDWKGYTKK